MNVCQVSWLLSPLTQRPCTLGAGDGREEEEEETEKQEKEECVQRQWRSPLAQHVDDDADERGVRTEQQTVNGR